MHAEGVKQTSQAADDHNMHVRVGAILLICEVAFLAAGCGGGGGNVTPTVSFLEPAVAAVVAPGASVQIEYVDSDPDDIALTTLYADRDGDLATTGDQITIEADRPDRDGAPQSVLWDTTGYAPGTYHVLAVTDDGTGEAVTATASGTLRLDAAPTVTVSGPAADVTVRAGGSIRVDYADDDVDDVAQTTLYADEDGDPATTGDRIAIGTARPEQGGAPQSVDWDTTGTPTGSYFLVAVSDDGYAPAVTSVAPGKVMVYNPGNAIELLGDGGHIAFAEALIGDRSTFTFECWIKPTWPPVDGAPNPFHNILYGETYALDGVRHQIEILSEDPTISGQVLGAVGCIYWVSPDLPEAYSHPVHENQWQHLAVVSDSGWLRIYVDGVLHDEGPAQSYAGPVPNLFRIGNNFDRTFGRYVIDEVRVSSTARYASNFVPGAVLEADGDTLSLWHFDETQGADVVDAAGNMSAGSLTPTATRVVADRSALAAATITDDFEDGVIDPQLWEVFLPFGGSSATESGGTLNLTQRPYIASVDEWIPTPAVPLAVEFDWTPASSISHLNLLMRSDANWQGTYAEAANGVGLNFSVDADLVWGYTAVDGVGGGVGIDFGDHPYTFTAGQAYRIRLESDGTTLRVFVDDMTTPLAEGTATLTFPTNRVVFYNREIGSGPDRFDNIEITGLRRTR
jgi:hypothetical protein